MCGPSIPTKGARSASRGLRKLAMSSREKTKAGCAGASTYPPSAHEFELRNARPPPLGAGGWGLGANHRWQRSGKREAGPRGGEGRARSGCPGSRRVTGPTLGGARGERRDEGAQGARHVRAVAPDGAAADGGFSRAREVGWRANLWLDLRLLHLSSPFLINVGRRARSFFSVGGSCETLAVNFTSGGPTHGHAGEARADVQSFAALAATGGDAELSSKFSRPKLAPGSFEFCGFGVTYTYWRRATNLRRSASYTVLLALAQSVRVPVGGPCKATARSARLLQACFRTPPPGKAALPLRHGTSLE